MSNENLKPWERQDGETEKAFSAFKAYLEMEEQVTALIASYVDEHLELFAKIIK